MHPNITLLLKQKSNKKIPISSMKFKNKIISWAANENSKKRFISNNNYWTIQASQDYSNKNISLYKKSKYRCSKKILNEFSRVIGLKPKDFEIFRIHGWKYSFSKVKTGQKYFWNKKYRLGICGDWFIGPNAESSWKSALALYDKIKKNPSSKTKRV